jgi:hypothetical protein
MAKYRIVESHNQFRGQEFIGIYPIGAWIYITHWTYSFEDVKGYIDGLNKKPKVVWEKDA